MAARKIAISFSNATHPKKYNDSSPKEKKLFYIIYLSVVGEAFVVSVWVRPPQPQHRHQPPPTTDDNSNLNFNNILLYIFSLSRSKISGEFFRQASMKWYLALTSTLYKYTKKKLIESSEISCFFFRNASKIKLHLWRWQNIFFFILYFAWNAKSCFIIQTHGFDGNCMYFKKK